MSNFPNYNFPAFHAKAAELRAQGHVVISPAELDIAHGFNESTDSFTDSDLDFAIMRDVAAIIRCDAIVLLPGWEKSRGATGEKGVAEWKRLQVFLPNDEIPAA